MGSRVTLSLSAVLWMMGMMGPLQAEDWLEPGVSPTNPVLRVVPKGPMLSLPVGSFERLTMLRTLAKDNPTSFEDQYRLALYAFRSGGWAEAADVAQKAYLLDKNNPDNQALWGRALLRLKKLPDSIWVLERLLQQNPPRDWHDVYYDLSTACLGLRWYDKAIQYGERHVLIGETPTGRLLLSRATFAAGYKDRAYQELLKSFTLQEAIDDKRNMQLP
jgi:tetratricopeptide (TPR) repeat protein